MSIQHTIPNELELLFQTLPTPIHESLLKHSDDPNDLLEVILDLGRLPEARYRSHERFLSDSDVSALDIEQVIAHIGLFGEDNRAGIPRTLHRISAIRNRSGTIIGLTCRVGRAIFGTVAIIRDIIETGKSILLLGKPGTGKTTLLRETARVLAEDMRKRVVVVDTSNEIAGDGDVPHPGIGRARRMQVARPAQQHAVMIEAVENHMPEVIVIDEIGTELEALAARTIAERGVQLIGTAHGTSLDNLLANPTLSDLIGGIQAVTLGDEEARRRGTQKTVLERKSSPTFDILVEILGWDSVAFYADVAAAVDAFLLGEDVFPEVRVKDDMGNFQTRIEKRRLAESNAPFSRRTSSSSTLESTTKPAKHTKRDVHLPSPNYPSRAPKTMRRIFSFGVNRQRLRDTIEHLDVAATIVQDMNEANLVITLKSYYRRHTDQITTAEQHGKPVYVLRNNSALQMERLLADIFHLHDNDNDYHTDAIETDSDTINTHYTDMYHDHDAYEDDDDDDDNTNESVNRILTETEMAIMQVINGERDAIEMAPQNSYVRRLQHIMAKRYNVHSKSRGNQPYRRVRISR